MAKRWRGGMRGAVVMLVAGLLGWAGSGAWGQVVPPVPPVPPVPVTPPATGGVLLDGSTMLRTRAVDTSGDLAKLRARVQEAEGAAKDQGLGYVSLPRLLSQVRALAQAQQAVPEELRYLGGLTQLRYVFVYPEEHDLVLAGPMEPWDDGASLQPVGKVSGRPVLHLDDLVVALRTLDRDAGRSTFGCSIDPTGDALKKAGDVMARNDKLSDKELLKQVAEAVGPQKVTLINAPADTRLALVLVAADYHMKRFSLGAESSPVVAIGSGVDASRTAANRFWFEPKYEPLLVSAEGTAYALRGPRLQLKCGAQWFDERGATDTAQRWAKAFSAKVPALAAVVPMFADLQNVADLTLLATLIREEKLDRKAGWDMDAALGAYVAQRVSVPQTVDTQATMTAGSLVAGGVYFEMISVVGAARQTDTNGQLAGVRARPADGWKMAAKAAGR